MTAVVTVLAPDGTWEPAIVAGTGTTQGGNDVVDIDGELWVVREVEG